MSDRKWVAHTRRSDTSLRLSKSGAVTWNGAAPAFSVNGSQRTGMRLGSLHGVVKGSMSVQSRSRRGSRTTRFAKP